MSRLHDHTQTHHIRYDYSGRVISPTQGSLPDKTQHSQVTDTYDTGGIRNRNPSKRKTEDRTTTGITFTFTFYKSHFLLRIPHAVI